MYEEAAQKVTICKVFTSAYSDCCEDVESACTSWLRFHPGAEIISMSSAQSSAFAGDRICNKFTVTIIACVTQSSLDEE